MKNLFTLLIMKMKETCNCKLLYIMTILLLILIDV